MTVVKILAALALGLAAKSRLADGRLMVSYPLNCTGFDTIASKEVVEQDRVVLPDEILGGVIPFSLIIAI